MFVVTLDGLIRFYHSVTLLLVVLLFCHVGVDRGLLGIPQAAQAVQSGVCVDLFAVTNEYTDLASLKYLSIESGGGLLLYSNTDEATLPQDL